MPGPREWDAVVVGAGPAGSATAARLARAGFAVLLLDRAEFPRRKPCGECVNPAGVEALGRLGALPAVLAAGPATLEGWRIRAGGAVGFQGGFPDGRTGLGIAREVLDPLLLEHARACGAEVRTGVRVRDLLREGPAVRGVAASDGSGGLEIPARVVVGADGLRSVVLRRLGLVRRAPRLRKVALTAHVRGADGLGTRGELRVRRGACLGIAPVGGGLANVSIVVAGDAGRAVGGTRRGSSTGRCGISASRGSRGWTKCSPPAPSTGRCGAPWPTGPCLSATRPATMIRSPGRGSSGRCAARSWPPKPWAPRSSGATPRPPRWAGTSGRGGAPSGRGSGCSGWWKRSSPGRAPLPRCRGGSAAAPRWPTR